MNREMEREEALLMSASFVLGILLAGFVYWRTGDAQRVWIILESVIATQVVFHIIKSTIEKEVEKGKQRKEEDKWNSN